MAERLRVALNLGWSIAELRGRLRYGNCEPPGTVDYQFPRELHALPLGGEHSLTEQQIASRVAVALLAKRLGLDTALTNGGVDPSEWMKQLAITLDGALEAAEDHDHTPPKADQYPPDSEIGKAWDAVANAIYYWDEQIQDRLSVSAELLAAYQLGRGLAEAFWALDSELETTSDQDPPSPSSWEFLLGEHRNTLLTGYLKLLEGALPPLSVPAVKGPLDRWCALVASGSVRSHTDAPTKLREQLQVWRDVLLGAREPASFATRFGVKVGARQLKRVVQAFGLELLLGGLSIGVLAVAGYYLGANKTSSGWAVVASILGFFGVTGAGLLARAKTQAQALFERLREAFYRDVVSDKATVLPEGVKP